MNLLWILHFLIVLAVNGARIEENGYKDITISFAEANLGESFDFGKLKDILKKASELLFHATKKRSYFEEFTLVLPPTWSGKSICDKNITEVPKNVDIYVVDSTNVPTLTTQHSKGCGEKGDVIYLPQNWLIGPTEDLALQFVQQWAVFRYGVFQENPDRSGSCIATSESTWSPAGCYNIDLETEVEFDEDGIPLCYFPDDFSNSENLLSSIMFPANSSKVLNFCDGSESFPHNPIAPTLHNRICDGNNVWSVIEKTEDFLYARNLPLKVAKPPKIPIFSCFKETKTHLSIVIQDTDSEARSEIRYGLFHFLSIIEPTDFSVSLATFSNDSLTEAVNPVELNLEDKGGLKSLLDLQVKLNEKVSNVCLICGLHKAYKVSTTSQYQRVIILLAWESSLKATKPSELIELIQSNMEVVLNLLFLEDTVNDIIPTSLIDAIQDSGGQIFRLKNEAEFMLTQLNVALLHASKNIFHLKDKILVVHKKSYKNVKSDIIDVFVTPKHTKGKLLYSMQCRKRGDVRNIDNTCTDRDKDLQSPICGSEVDISDNEISEKVWRYTFQYMGGSEGTTCTSLALLKLESSSISSFTLKGWLSENRITPGRNVLMIYAEIFGNTEMNFQVEARISGPGLEEFLLELRDNGNGDPDVIKRDNIYSRYFTSFSQKGTYTVSIYAQALGEYKNDTYSEGKFKESSMSISRKFKESAMSISQTKIIGTFRVTQSPPTEDIYPPNQVSDLRVISIANTDRSILLQWTAPGDDYDYGKASKYNLYITNDWRNLQETLLSKIPFSSLNAREITPKIYDNEEEEEEEFKLPNNSQPIIYYIALKALDKSGNKGKLSNIIQVSFMLEKLPNENATNKTNTRNNTETTGNLKNAESNITYWYIVIGSIIIFLIIINTLVWVFCLKKYQRINRSTKMKDNYDKHSRTGNDINTDENILRSEYEDSRSKYEQRQSEERIENQSTDAENSGISNPLVVYARVEKQDKKSKNLISHNSGTCKIQQTPKSNENDLGYI